MTYIQFENSAVVASFLTLPDYGELQDEKGKKAPGKI